MNANELADEQSRIFECKPNVRWLEKGDVWTVKILQQAWVCRITGEIEWRDVETAYERMEIK